MRIFGSFVLLGIFCALAACTSFRPLEWDGRTPPASGKPVCRAQANLPEGWLKKDGSVERANCGNKVVYCAQVGTSNEGWYAAEIGTEQLIHYTNCSEDLIEKPECVQLGMYAEGWDSPRRHARDIHWDSCRHKIPECRRQGTEQEGWYGLMPKLETAQLVRRTKCGEVLLRSSYYPSYYR